MLECEKGVFNFNLMEHVLISVSLQAPLRKAKHISIQKPGLSGSAFYNYKGGCRVLLIAVADADYRFQYVDVGACGREHDSTVFNRSGFGQRLTRGELSLPGAEAGELPYCFAADEAFPLREMIIRPYSGH